VVAGLARHLGDLELAEDALQDACVAALNSWPQQMPDNPAAWLTTTAKRKAVDRIRRTKVLDTKYETIARTRVPTANDPLNNDVVEDDRLRLIFTCCHPALNTDASVALTLKTIGGLSTREIASAHLIPETTMAQRIVRAKRKIRDAGIPYRVPSDRDLPARLPEVLEVIYLIFNEGYASSSSPDLLRPALAAEAIRLATIVDNLLPNEPEVLGLLSLMHFHEARAAARTDADGQVVLLDDQDRSLWDADETVVAQAYLGRALLREAPGPYQIQAAISACHTESPSAEETDWDQIAALYGSLRRYVDSPVVQLNHAVAVAMATDPQTGLVLIDGISGLEDYVYFHTARASLLADTGDDAGATAAYERALEVATSDHQRIFIKDRLTSPAP